MGDKHDSLGVVDWRILAGLAVLTLAVFGQVAGYGFLNYDDNVYVTENPNVLAGLTGAGLHSALFEAHNAGWNPLAIVSHMLDVQVFGLRPGFHHLHSLLLHLANTLLLYLVMRRMTGARWKSAAVAALFAVHPLHVEPVAWISSRKDVLSTLFWLLTMWSYALYAERGRFKDYMLAMVWLCLGLMAKPMLVTVPCVLMLLDYWPLGRYGGADTRADMGRRAGMLFLEKVPLFALVAVVSAITFMAQRGGGAVRTLTEVPFTGRLANVCMAYTAYVTDAIWPSHLAIYYPLPDTGMTPWHVSSALLLVGATVAVLADRKRGPYLPVGWLWYLGTLVPVIGIVQIGSAARADRFTYVPLIGLCIVAVWGCDDIAKRLRVSNRTAGLIAAAVVLAYAGAAAFQMRYWRSSEAVFSHALQVTSGNAVAHNNLGVALQEGGHPDAAREHFEAALQITPDFIDAHNNLGVLLAESGETDAAANHYRAVLALDPQAVDARINLGNAMLAEDRLDEAIAYYADALKYAPQDLQGHYNLGLAFQRQGQYEAAAVQFREVVALRQDHADGHVSLANALLMQGKPEEALPLAETAVQLDPGHANAYYNLGLAFMLLGKVREGAGALRKTVELDPNHADAHYNLAVALAQLDDLAGAAHHFEETLRINPGNAQARQNLEQLRGGLGGAR
jgi:protein O-mannosyl-transferase